MCFVKYFFFFFFFFYWINYINPDQDFQSQNLNLPYIFFFSWYFVLTPYLSL